MIRKIKARTNSGTMPEKNNRTTLPQSLKRFQFYLCRNGKATETMRAYERDLQEFHSFVKVELRDRIRYVDQLKATDVELYKDHLHSLKIEGKISKSTEKRRFYSLKTYFHYLNQTYGVEDITKFDKFANSLRDQSGSKSEDIENKIVAEWELSNLFGYLKQARKENKYRNLCLFSILYHYGCRKEELLKLKWEDIDLSKNTLRIRRSKTSNTNLLPLEPSVKEQLLQYYGVANSSSAYLFPSENGSRGHLSDTAFYDMFNRTLKEADLRLEITPRHFRHTFITTCLRSGVAAEIIIQYTGHSSVTGLKPYTHLVPPDMSGVSKAMNDRLAS